MRCWLAEGLREMLGPVDDPGVLHDYWARMLPDLPGHPLHDSPHLWRRSVPLALWGDEATVSRKTYMAVTWLSGSQVVLLVTDVSQ